MKTAFSLGVWLAISYASFADPSSPAEQLASQAALIVHCRSEKAADGSLRLAVIETWKGAYFREAFNPVPPQGFILQPGRNDLPDGDVILFYFKLRQAAGKLQRYDLALPVIDGKISYPTGNAQKEARQEWTLTAFKTAIQISVRFPLVNGDFDASPAGSIPEGWKPAYPTGEAVVATDGKDSFLRLTNDRPVNAGVLQQVPIPGDASTIAILGRMRGKPKNGKEDKRAAVEVAVRFLDAAGSTINAAVVSSSNSPSWHTFRRDFPVPPGSARAEVVARSIFAMGTFDFDSVRVEFK